MVKKILILLIGLFFVQPVLFGQCTNTSSWGSAVAPTDTTPATISTCNYQTEYGTVSNVVAGETYQITNDCGGYITVRSGTFDGPVVGSGNAPFSFTATVSGNHYIHFNTDAGCGTATNCCTTTISCTSCGSATPPSNDLCTTATTLNCGDNLAGTTVGSSNLASGTGCTISNYGVWYTFVGDGDQTTISSTSSGGYDHEMAIVSGSCGALTNISCQDTSLGNGTESYTFTTTVGVTYYVYVAHWLSTSTTTGNFNITRTCTTVTPPPNDDPCNAVSLTPDIICNGTSGSVEFASNSGIDACFGTPDNDVWYSFEATDTTHEITLFNIAGSDFDLYHAVYGPFTSPDCSVAVTDNISCSDPNSSTITGLTIGATYFVQVFTYFTGPETTTFDICVTEPPPPPPNDEPCNAVALTPDISCNGTYGYVEGATNSGIDACFGTPNDDVWYSFVATETSHNIDISNVSGSPTDLYHAVYGGFTAPDCSVTVGDNISCSDANESAVGGLTIGDTYFIQVFTYSSAGGATTSFDICVTEPCSLPTAIGTDPCPMVDVTPDTSSVSSCSPTSNSETLTATYLDLGDTSDYDVDLITFDPTTFANFEAAANTVVALSDDDRWSNLAYGLPIDFCYYGNSVNQIVVGANSMVAFDGALANTPCGFSYNDNLPSTNGALFENVIYAAYHDIDPGVGGSIRFGTTSSNGCNAFVVLWDNVPMYYDNSLFSTTMLVLYENTNIIEVYIEEKVIDGGAPWNNGNCIVGVQNPGATEAVVAPCRNGLDDNWVATNEAWRFTPSGGSSIATLQWLVDGVLEPTYDGQTSITVTPSSTTTYTAQVTYNLCDGSTLVESDDTTITVTAGKVWDGSEATNDWMEPDNWSDGLVPTPADCVIIPNTGNDPVLYDNDNGDGLFMVIENGATLTLMGDTDNNNFASSVTIQDYIDIQPGGNLIIEDDASLIQVYDATTVTPPSASNTGNIELRRTTNIRQTDYVYWSSPVESFDVSNIYGGFTPTNYIFEWTPTVPTGTYVPGVPPTGGQPICYGTWNPMSSGVMDPGKGYIVRGPTNHTAGPSLAYSTFIGVANNGVITQPISSGNNPDTNDPYWYNPYGVDDLQVTHFDDNWNLLGNPYPSALDANSFLTHPNNNSIEGAVHIWTHGTQIGANGDSFYDDYLLTYEENDYVTYNLSGTNSYPDESFAGKIASGQGFFVLTLNDNESGSVTFENDMRDRTHSNTAFYRNAEPSENANSIERHRIWLNLISNSGTVSSTMVGYIQDATHEKDRLYDAYAREINNLSFYSKIGDDRMIIQGRQLPFDINDQVPLGTVIPEPGEYTIAISALDGLFLNSDQNINIYLEDRYNNIIHDLRSAPYFFNVAESIDFEDRFILRYTNETLSTVDLELNSLTIKAPKGEYIKVVSGHSPIESVTLYDLLGRVLIHDTSLNRTEHVIENKSFSVGPYLVQVTLSNGLSKTQKVVLK